MIQNHHNSNAQYWISVTLVTLLEFGFSAQMDNLSEIKVTMTFLSFFFPLLTPRHFQIIPTLNRTKYRWGRKRENWGWNGWLWNHKPALWQLDPGLRSFLHTLKWNTLLLKSRSATLKPPAKLWASEGRERETRSQIVHLYLTVRRPCCLLVQKSNIPWWPPSTIAYCLRCFLR